MTIRLTLRVAITGALLGLAACGDQPAGPAPMPPAILTSAVTPDAYNALSALLTVHARHADSVAVRYNFAGAGPATDSVTPRVALLGDSAAIPVLGLLPDRRYTLHVVASGAGGAAVGDSLEFTSGTLPPDLPHYTAAGPDPSPGFVVFASGKYALVIGNDGRVVWYRRFDNGVGLNFMAQPTGRYVVRPPTPAVGDVEPWLELDPTGTVTRTLACALGLQSRPHDLILDQDGSYLILCDETRTLDLSAFGGVAAARVTGTVVQHVSAAGELLFQWSAFDHFEITDLAPAERTGATVNWTHGNALDRDTDGNLIVSFRSLGEITKIDAATGTVIWRMGGLRNEFVFLDTPSPAFARQHGARVYGPGGLLLLDNMGSTTESRAEHYAVDAAARTVRLVGSYGSIPGVVTEIGGSVQPLAGGRTLVSFGTAGRVEEYDAAGRLVWHIQGNPGYVFRAQRIRSLYAPGVGSAR